MLRKINFPCVRNLTFRLLLQLLQASSYDKDKPKAKRKRVVLTLEEKLEVIKMLNKAVSYTIISEKFWNWPQHCW